MTYTCSLRLRRPRCCARIGSSAVVRGVVVVFELSEKSRTFRERVEAFMDELIYPNEAKYHEQLDASGNRWSVPRVMEELKNEAKARGLWNLFLPDSDLGAGLTNLEYAPLCEVMGRSPIAPEVFNCNAPDTGNMEVLVRDDRARGGFFGRDQYRGAYREGRG